MRETQVGQYLVGCNGQRGICQAPVMTPELLINSALVLPIVVPQFISQNLPEECAAEGYGDFGGRRPASNVDSYQTTGIMI